MVHLGSKAATSSLAAALALAGCSSQTVCEKLEIWQQQNGACAASTVVGGIEGGPWIPPAASCATGFAQCSEADQETLKSYADCLPNCPQSALGQFAFDGKLALCAANKAIAPSCAAALNGETGGSMSGGASSGTGASGGAGGGGGTTAAAGASSGAGTSTSSGGVSSSSGGASSSGGGTSGGASSGGGTTGCVAYGAPCTAACCSGLACDPGSNVCLVADGQPCPSETCAAPDVCDPSGVCGACIAQNGACQQGGIACCGGLTCTKSNGNKDYCL